MQAELKAKWIAALRSGEYKQARGVLYSKGKFCCLGVALKHLHGFIPQDGEDILSCFIETERTHWQEPLRSDGMTQFAIDELVRMNDTGSSFEQIADWIEQYVQAGS